MKLRSSSTGALRLTFGIACVMLLAPAPRAAEAKKKRVVVLPFSGPGGGTVRRGVIASIKRKAQIVTPRRYKKAGGGSEPDSIAAACSKAKCDAVVTGAVSKRKRRFSVVVTVFDGGTGEKIGSRAAKVRSKRKLAGAGAAIGRGCVRLVQKGKFKKAGSRPKPPPEPPPVAAAPPPKPAVAAKTDTSDIPVYKPGKDRSRGSAEDEEDEDGADVKKGTRSGPRGPGSIFDVSAGIGLAFRNAVLSSTDPTVTTVPNTYDGGMYPEILVNAAVYPLIPFMKGFATGFGVGASFSHHLSISSKPKTNADESVWTSSWQLLFDLRYRWIIFDKLTSPEVTIFGGYGMRNFNLGQNTILTSLNYKFIRLGLEGRVPIMTRLFAVNAGFDVRPLMGAGQEAVDAFGDRDGGFAWSVRAGVSGSHQLGIFYFLTFEYLRHTIAFKGLKDSGGLQNRPGWPDRQDATSGSDRYIRIWLGGGYAY